MDSGQNMESESQNRVEDIRRKEGRGIQARIWNLNPKAEGKI